MTTAWWPCFSAWYDRRVFRHKIKMTIFVRIFMSNFSKAYVVHNYMAHVNGLTRGVASKPLKAKSFMPKSSSRSKIS